MTESRVIRIPPDTDLADHAARTILTSRADQPAEWETFLDAVQAHLDNAGCEVQLAASLTDRTAEIALPDGSTVHLDAGTLAATTPNDVAQQIIAGVPADGTDCVTAVLHRVSHNLSQ